MAAAALLKFTQGVNVGGNGEALKGVTGALVNVTNSDNTDVASWQIDLLYSDPASAVSPATPFAFNDNSSTPLATFTPDVRGSYRWRLRVWAVPNRVGDPVETDIRIFNVPELHGLVVPPAQLWPRPLPVPQSGEPGNKPSEFNFSGQPDGWAGDGGSDGLLNDALRSLDPLPSRVSTLETDVDTLQTDVSDLQSDVTTLQSSVSTLQSNVSTLQGEVADLKAQVVKYPGVVGSYTTNLTTPLSVGSLVIDPTKFANRTFKFEAVLFTKDVLATANVQLYNLTDGEFVTGTLLTSTSLTLEYKVSATLTVGAAAGNLKNSFKLYEIQLSRSGGTSDHFVDVHLAQLTISI